MSLIPLERRLACQVSIIGLGVARECVVCVLGGGKGV